MRVFGLIGVLVASLALIPAQSSTIAAAQESCTFTLGFKALRDQIPDIVGNCLENERFNLENGNAEQRTTGGLLVWRKADNWTAFTDGSTTWINGPDGLASRPNAGPLFDWESPAAESPATPAVPASGGAPPPPPPPPPPPAPAASAEPWIGDIMFGTDPSGAGAVPSGGTLKGTGEITLYYFMSWRNFPPGSKIRVERYQAKNFRGATEPTLNAAAGKGSGPVVRYGEQPRGSYFPSTDFSVVFLYNGQQVARGYVLME